MIKTFSLILLYSIAFSSFASNPLSNEPVTELNDRTSLKRPNIELVEYIIKLVANQEVKDSERDVQNNRGEICINGIHVCISYEEYLTKKLHTKLNNSLMTGYLKLNDSFMTGCSNTCWFFEVKDEINDSDKVVKSNQWTLIRNDDNELQFQFMINGFNKKLVAKFVQEEEKSRKSISKIFECRMSSGFKVSMFIHPPVNNQNKTNSTFDAKFELPSEASIARESKRGKKSKMITYKF